MRITGGGLKGRTVPDKKMNLRPTTNRAKQSLFNILENRLQWENCTCCDLFSGTGSITYELASRGCKQVIAVDISPENCNFIKSNIRNLGLNNVVAVRSDVLSFLRKSRNTFSLIFADPPFDYPNYPAIHRLVFEKKLLEENGLLIIEHSRRTSFTDFPFFIEQRKYGEVNFSIFGGIKK